MIIINLIQKFNFFNLFFNEENYQNLKNYHNPFLFSKNCFIFEEESCQ